MDLNKIILIKKRTPLEDLLRRHTTKSQVKFYLESRGESFEYYQKIHNNYVVGFENIKLQLPKEIRKQEVLRDYLDTFQFGENDLIVVVGGDGLLVNAAKYVGEQPAILVNPDPENHGGVLATCDHVGFSKVIKSVLSKNYEVEELTMAQAKLDDGQILFALNDLFIGRQTHISARYRINYLGREERQSSSGLIVTTGTGSTGWFTSIELGARKISEQLSSIGGSYARGRDVAGDNLTEFFKLTTSTAFNRSENYLKFAVREPFPTKGTGTNVIYGKINSRWPLTIVSEMPEGGVIFSDGIESDYLEFNAGKTAVITPSEKKVNLVKSIY